MLPGPIRMRCAGRPSASGPHCAVRVLHAPRNARCCAAQTAQQQLAPALQQLLELRAAGAEQAAIDAAIEGAKQLGAAAGANRVIAGVRLYGGVCVLPPLLDACACLETASGSCPACNEHVKYTCAPHRAERWHL